MRNGWPTGTIVYLKSESPPLTVSDLQRHTDESLISVEWFLEGEVQRDEFHKDCLITEVPKVQAKYYA